MSKTDATPEKQNRQVAREKSYKSVNRRAVLILQFARLEKLRAARPLLVRWCTLPFETFGPSLLHTHQEGADENAENWKRALWGIGRLRRYSRNLNRVTGLPDLGGPVSRCLLLFRFGWSRLVSLSTAQKLC